MTRYIAGRLLVLPLSLLLVSFATFMLLHIVPGDAVDAIGGVNLGAADAAQLRQRYGLDQPLLAQYLLWLTNLLQGDLGISIRTHRPVLAEVTDRLGTTLELATLSVLFSVAIGIAGGTLAMRWRNSWVDRGIAILSTIGMSVPSYFVATLFILAVSLYFPTVGVVSYVPLSKGVVANIQSLLLPALALSILSGATFVRYVRGAGEDLVRNADFIRTARSKGARPTRILLRHLLPNMLIPLTTAAGIQVAYLIGGAVIIESVFALPGLGQLMLAAIGQRDYPLVQGCVLLQATSFVVINLLVDLLYPVLDPRVRSTHGR